MKKIATLVMALCIFTFASAQEESESDAMVSKKGFVILPEAGDYALGFNAVPALNFALNAVNVFGNVGATAGNPTFVTGNANVIVGKYYVSETAVHVCVLL